MGGGFPYLSASGSWAHGNLCMHGIATLKQWLVWSGARDVARSGAPEGSAAGWELVFHKGQSQVSKPQAAAICAGVGPRMLLQPPTIWTS